MHLLKRTNIQCHNNSKNENRQINLPNLKRSRFLLRTHVLLSFYLLYFFCSLFYLHTNVQFVLCNPWISILFFFSSGCFCIFFFIIVKFKSNRTIVNCNSKFGCEKKIIIFFFVRGPGWSSIFYHCATDAVHRSTDGILSDLWCMFGL